MKVGRICANPNVNLLIGFFLLWWCDWSFNSSKYNCVYPFMKALKHCVFICFLSHNSGFNLLWTVVLELWVLSCCVAVIMLDHYNDVIMSTMASQITSHTTVYSTIYSGEDQRNIKALRHLPVTGEFPAQRASKAEMFPFDDMILIIIKPHCVQNGEMKFYLIVFG